MSVKLKLEDIQVTKQTFFSRQFVAFLAAGLLGALLHWTYRYFLNQFISYSHALVIAYGLSLFTGFLLSKYLVFSCGKKTGFHQATYFFIFNILMFPVVFGISYVLSELILNNAFSFNVARGLGHAIALGIHTIPSFLFQKYIIFDE